MEKTREEFIVSIRQAINDRNSVAFKELYQFLVNCFLRADASMTGQVRPDRFDTLIEEAAAMPRLYGFAPKTSEMYPTDAEKQNGRAALFAQIDTDKSGYVTLDKWIDYALDHIERKVTTKLPKDVLAGSAEDVSKEEFLNFMKKAVVQDTPEYKELYYFLIKTFIRGDTERTGRVGVNAFDKMIEEAAAAPRRFGLAPKSIDMFPDSRARINKRKEYFTRMDTDGNGTISLDEWLTYAMEHIKSKVAGLR